MGRTRDVSKILTSNTSILTLASASATYATKASSGLTLINTTSFTGQSTVSIDNVFSTTYHHYRIIINFQPTNAQPRLRLRASGTDATSADYSWQHLQGNNTTLLAERNVGDTTWNLTGVNGGNQNMYLNIEMYNPFASVNTWGLSSSYQSGNAMFNDFRMNTSTSYDGFTLYPTSSTITGALSVFGYNK